MSQRDDIEKLIKEHNRRLQKLKEQQARYGYLVEPHIALEIEDIEAKLEELRTELKRLTAGAGSPTRKPTSTASITAPIDETTSYYSCFISYAHKDETFAEKLYTDLQQVGVRCWYAPEDMKIGDKIRTRVDQSVRSHDKLLLILSRHSIDSPWVESEVEAAFEEECKHKHLVLFPIRLDSMVMDTDQAWAADIRRTRHVGDFSRWQDSAAYQKSLKRLLRDLKL